MRARRRARSPELIVTVSIEEASGPSWLEFPIPSETELGALGRTVSERVSEWSRMTERRPRKWAVVGLHSPRGDSVISWPE